MKRLFAYLLIGCITALCVACGEKETESENNPLETVATTTAVTTTEAVTTTKATTTTKAATTTKATTTTEAPTEEEVYTEEVTEAPTEAVASGGYFDASDVYAYYNGYALTVNQDITSFPAASSVDASPSCYYEGEDKIFHYGDMDVYTYPSGGADYVLEITLYSANASTARGLTVGMTLDDAIAMYGVGTDGGGIYSWYSGSTYMYVTTSDNVITSIGLALSN